MGTLYGMSIVGMVRSWRPQVLPESQTRPRPLIHDITLHHKTPWYHETNRLKITHAFTLLSSTWQQMVRCAPAMCITGLPGWMTTALESVQTRRNAMYSLMESPSLKAMTGDARAMSMCGTQWVRHTGLQLCTHAQMKTKIHLRLILFSFWLFYLFQANTMRHVMGPPPAWPSTPPASLWGQRSWRSWSTGNVNAGSTAPLLLTTACSMSQVETNLMLTHNCLHVSANRQIPAQVET